MFATGGLKRVLPPSEYFQMNIDLKNCGFQKKADFDEKL
jgi:hypothetical protein